MTERNIAAEVLDGLREVGEHRAGTRTLRTAHVEPRPLPELTPDALLTPNAETVAAMKEARAESLPSFDDAESLLDDLHAED